MKHLELIFAASDKKIKTMRLNYVNEELDGATVRAAMDQISALEMFERDGVKQYAEPLAARYSQTINEPIFDIRK